MRVFETRREVRGGSKLCLEEHLVAVVANWRAKSANLRALAAELSLDLGSFVFVDDSPAECAEVAAGTEGSGLARQDDGDLKVRPPGPVGTR